MVAVRTIEHINIAVTPRAWTTEFVESAAAVPAGVEVIHITQPRNIAALLKPLSVSEVLSDLGSNALSPLTVMWMPPGVNAPASVERDVEEWIGSARVERKQVIVRAEVRSLRLVWADTRAVIYSSEGDLRYALDAILRFSVVQSEALALEDNMRSSWSTIEADAALTHALTMRDLKMQRHVNHMTEITTRMKIAWLRISKSLEQLDPALSEPSKRIFAELVSAASLYDRVESLENPVQFGLDHYEISNTRLIDMYLARIDRVNSIFGYGIIIILLIIQTWIMMIEVGWL